VIKFPCHPNAGDQRERLKALSAAGEICVVFERLAQRYRVIAFDRFGFGHTNQPRSRTWTPTVQVELVQKALIQLDIQQAIVGGISVSGR
jgi:pimeloyl-ACP methyl ester carboxylesterase